MISYSNPLFSIIVFLLIIAITIIITNFLGSLKEKNRIKHLKEFIDKFEFLNDKEIKTVLKNEVSINALFLLAMAFEKEGNYEKSLNIYLAILENVNKNEKFDVLQKVAKVYFQAGFLHKSREALLEILRSKPRNKEALKLLLIVDDKLKNYDEMENIIEIFEELEVDVEKEKCYILFKKALFEMDKKRLKELYKKHACLKRSYILYLIQSNPKEVFDEVKEDDVYEMIDIFYNYESLPVKNNALIQIKAAKKELETTMKSPIFELEVLKYLPKGLADLEFEYICQNCKHIYPIYDERCPNCKELFSFKVEAIISKNNLKYRESYN
jgi:lipopolysaccharide biosynthesis regulator YciM